MGLNRLERVLPWNIEDASSIEYDLFVACLGYERRSRYIAETGQFKAKRRLAVGFRADKILSYRTNRRWFSENGFELIESADSTFRGCIGEAINPPNVEVVEPIKICVDISSMSRLRIASVLAEIIRRSPRAEVDFVYTVAKYVRPEHEIGQIESVGPVLSEFAGWSSEPHRPASAIFGLGYEYNKAIGVLDYIEPAEMWAFQAVSPDHRYDKEAEKANKFFWSELPAQRRLKYSLDSPFDAFMDLESLTNGVARHCRPILIPFGPKIFSLCCLLVALVHEPTVAVWRVSSGSNDLPVDRISDGSLIGLRAVFGPREMEGSETGQSVNL